MFEQTENILHFSFPFALVLMPMGWNASHFHRFFSFLLKSANKVAIFFLFSIPSAAKNPNQRKSQEILKNERKSELVHFIYRFTFSYPKYRACIKCLVCWIHQVPHSLIFLCF